SEVFVAGRGCYHPGGNFAPGKSSRARIPENANLKGTRILKSSLHGTLKARVLCALLLTSFAAAQTLTGTVKNSTTGKPAVGDEVVVFKLGQGMEEAGRTKTEPKAQFSFNLEDPQ